MVRECTRCGRGKAEQSDVGDILVRPTQRRLPRVHPRAHRRLVALRRSGLGARTVTPTLALRAVAGCASNGRLGRWLCCGFAVSGTECRGKLRRRRAPPLAARVCSNYAVEATLTRHPGGGLTLSGTRLDRWMGATYRTTSTTRSTPPSTLTPSRGAHFILSPFIPFRPPLASSALSVRLN